MTEVDYCPITGDRPAALCSVCGSAEDVRMCRVMWKTDHDRPVCVKCVRAWFEGGKWDATERKWVTA